MSEKQVRVTFQPQGRTVHVLPGTKLLEAAARAGLTIDTPCGGAGVCGKCRARITGTASAPSEADQNVFSATELREGWRLACQTTLLMDTVVYLPESSLFGSRHQIQVDSHTQRFEEIQPSVRKIYVELPAPSLQDDVPDLPRLEQRVGVVQTEIGLLRRFPTLLREHGFKGTAVLTDSRLIDFEPEDTAGQCYGAAFDIGTTTLVGSLMDLRTGRECAVAARMNPQVRFGDDVLSRIAHAGSSPAGLEALRQAVVAEIHAMLDDLCGTAAIPRELIYEIVFAGNTTMEHLLCGIDPAQLGQIPFVPVFAQGLLQPARDLDIHIHPRGAAYVFPVIGGFVGGDTVAGMLATRLASQDGPVVMVDIGTNGEIVLAHADRLLAASTAAGPAFEGARISCGMRATRGAIEKVVFEEDLHCSVIDNAAPMGLCGSGLIDLCAELLNQGVISVEGRLLPPEELPQHVGKPLRKRVRRNADGEVEVILAEGATNRIALNQRDVRELQLAAAAMRAGLNILLRYAGVEVGEIAQFLIAGGFGSFIRRNHAQRIGLIPPEIDHRRIRYVGNTSLSGARWVLLSMNSRRQAEALARRTKHVELSNHADFAMEFAMAMRFPPNLP